MSKIAILTDSSCDIPQELAEKYGIDIMSFHILLDDVDYIERESCTNEEFYEKMRAAKGIPSTAAITPIQFCEKYCQYVDEGYTDVIHVPINRSGSSTYNNAVMAQGMLREERPEHHLRIHLLDPHTYSMPFGWYVCEMARKLQNGAEISHVIQEFETQMDKMEIVLGPYSLKQMKKSGRIPAARRSARTRSSPSRWAALFPPTPAPIPLLWSTLATHAEFFLRTAHRGSSFLFAGRCILRQFVLYSLLLCFCAAT